MLLSLLIALALMSWLLVTDLLAIFLAGMMHLVFTEELQENSFWPLVPSSLTVLVTDGSNLALEANLKASFDSKTKFEPPDTGISGPLKFLLVQSYMKSLLPNKKRISNQKRQEIDGSSPTLTLKSKGSKLEIPLWLAKGLHDSKRRIISVELPKIYREAWRTVFSADANVVDLHKMGPYYYGFGSQLLNFENPENPEIAQTILQASI
ncbi:hypothetical protein TURU_157565 [Turdus rufiventris]|nr:hypothetical protein TURU_157565 [Turdus rufiventris]